MDNEFLLYLNSEIITDDYSDKFINSILKFIKDYCKADLVMLIDLESQRKDDFKTHDKGVQTEDGDFTVCLSACHNKLIIGGKKREFQNVGVLFVDANGLGILNNMYSYQKGDELLKTVSGSLKSNFRLSDIY